jgi:signal peptidase I
MSDISQTDPANPSQPSAQSGPRKQSVLENILSLFLSLLVVFAIRSSVVEAFKIPSGSMIPTLLTGDYIFVNKFAYGFNFPFSDWVMDAPLTLIHRDPPKRGDIVVFKYPKDESIYFIKRVIGTPGDTIELKDKTLYVNGKEFEHVELDAKAADAIFSHMQESKYSQSSLKIYNEHLDTKTHWIMLDTSTYSTNSFGPVTVPSDSLFCMGDNRDFSNDSRFWGFVPYKNVKGKAMVIWLSLWLDFSNSQYIFRPERIGTILN